ncbi:MAG: OsmC family protein [Actinomycetota bacterium]|nr:OsmC family protein [Actinomycetota bacterium]
MTASAGTFRPAERGVPMPHAWTSEGVVVECDFTGAHLLHLAVAGCVLNDLYREARELGVDLAGARVVASGAFDTGTWTSTGIHYRVDLDTQADPEDVRRLLARVDEVAEIPRAIRAGAAVQRVEVARS